MGTWSVVISPSHGGNTIILGVSRFEKVVPYLLEKAPECCQRLALEISCNADSWLHERNSEL